MVGGQKEGPRCSHSPWSPSQGDFGLSSGQAVCAPSDLHGYTCKRHHHPEKQLQMGRVERTFHIKKKALIKYFLTLLKHNLLTQMILRMLEKQLSSFLLFVFFVPGIKLTPGRCCATGYNPSSHQGFWWEMISSYTGLTFQHKIIEQKIQRWLGCSSMGQCLPTLHRARGPTPLLTNRHIRC